MQGMNKRVLALLGLGHLMVDLNTGALPALLPFLKSTFDLSYTMLSSLVLVANMSASFIQPVFGHWSDRSARAWLLPFGVIAATCGMATIGLASSYFGLLVLVFLSGIGIAAFHPEAYKTAYLATGEKKATGISLFSVGGNLGYGLGPLAVAFCLTMFGQSGLLLLWLPGLLTGALLLWMLPWISRNTEAASVAQVNATASAPYALAIVLGVVTLGACVHSGMVTYVPLYFAARGEDAVIVGSLLSLFLISGAMGTLVAGPISDRIGHKKFLTISMGILCPLIIAFLNAKGPLSIGLLVVIGACISPMFSVTLVIAQTLMKGRLGATAGLMMGLGIGGGGLGVTALGMVADGWGVETTMHVISCLPLLPWALVLLVPSGVTPPETAQQSPLQVATAGSD
jgi:FSR family fosmidomycin resistance protein-like MFS transporter